MRLTKKRLTIVVVCSVVAAAGGGPALAKRIHHKPVRQVAAPAAAGDVSRDGVPASRFPAVAARTSAPAIPHRRLHIARADVAPAAATPAPGIAPAISDSSLVSEARKYIGTNPTGRGSLWCGAFMDMVLKRTGHPGGGNLAWGYQHYGTRVSGPQVGAIAVMGRHGGGHVGVVTGIDASGNPIIVSGNHNNTVAESVYPRSRIAAYVVPGS